MKKQAYNPYLPLNEYVPDGESHVFGDRLYVYGSHDLAGGERYCMQDYVVWSAPVSDLSDWKYEGVSYRKDQDPSNPGGERALQAPDVAKGPDGRYYLYYCVTFVPEIGVAVSDSPAGPFEFYGHIRYPESIRNGKELNEYLPFDPAVLVDDDGKVWLYYGFCPEIDMEKPDMGVEEKQEMGISPGAMVAELEPDMLTLKEEPVMMVPGQKLEKGTEFEGHGFFEASSMRKVGEKYYFVYSSHLSHELCYAVSDYPNRGFSYGGTLISNGDIGYHGNAVPKNMMGNNHGGMVRINGQWYIFYHRQTHGTECSRQGCAEKITIGADGKIQQVEMTSCGLNAGALVGKGKYLAAIACNLICPGNDGKINYGECRRDRFPYLFQDGEAHYIANVQQDGKVGYKYFSYEEELSCVKMTVRGSAEGKVLAAADENGELLRGEADIRLENESQWQTVTIPFKAGKAVEPLYFIFEISGTLQFMEFEFM